MSGPRRLANGGLIDRTKTIRFSFDGNPLQGFGGDTLASALMANGVRLVGRSFKYHRPRGIFSAGPEEPNALVELRSGARREPNTKATTVELFEPEPLAVARLRCPRHQPARGSAAGGRLLLQGLHVAGGVLGENL
jgi:2Fe-2S iron-sulfur cluster binding domain